METLLLIITIVKRVLSSLFITRKIKLDEDQHNVTLGIAKELKIPKEEVLWMFVEFGQGLMTITQENKSVSKAMDKRKHLPEYKNWKRIAKLLYEFHKAGEEHPRSNQ